MPDGTGLGKALKSSIRPLRSEIPIYLAAEGPKNIVLSAELCEGWLALFYSPYHDGLLSRRARRGICAPGRPRRQLPRRRPDPDGIRARATQDKIRHDLGAWRDSIVTTLVIAGDAATLRTAAALVLG
jgi:alkanesulfonate monooxygenase SsuD/methylene tetrahydromethanopterin reductase-like flavin-dependent oxidoreductase (luciferase family)